MATAQTAISQAFPSTLADDIDLGSVNTTEHREALALRVSVAFTRAVQNLKDLKDDIEALWIEFDFLGTRETIMGCRGKREFCEKKLGRSLRAVQYMLDGGNHKRTPKTQEPVAPSETVSLPVKPVEPEPEMVDVKPESVPASVEPVEQPIIELKEDTLIRFQGAIYEVCKISNGEFITLKDGTRHHVLTIVAATPQPTVLSIEKSKTPEPAIQRLTQRPRRDNRERPNEQILLTEQIEVVPQ
jgi:hypothetical protein